MGGTDAEKKDVLERRQYFRIDDILPLVVTRVKCELPFLRSRILSNIDCDMGIPVMQEDGQEERTDANLWRMLFDINAKLNLILDKIFHDSEGIKKAEARKVNMSAAGARITIKDALNVEDVVELKMFLTVHPPVWIVVYGKVLRVDELADGFREVAVQFLDLSDEVSSLLDRYILRRQREMIRKQRDHEA